MELVLPISCKGIVWWNDRVVLVRNERAEFELPGGKLEPGETPEACMLREVYEEIGVAVVDDGIVHAWVYEPHPGRRCLVLAYATRGLIGAPEPRDAEERGMGMFDLGEVWKLHMPEAYKHAIARTR